MSQVSSGSKWTKKHQLVVTCSHDVPPQGAGKRASQVVAAVVGGQPSLEELNLKSSLGPQRRMVFHVRLGTGAWIGGEVCIWNGVSTEGTHECDWIGSCIDSLDDMGQEDGGRGRAQGQSSCLRLGSILCPCQFRKVAKAGK